MAENKQTTPEQQLLKLIEGQPKPGKAGKGQPKDPSHSSLAKLPGALLGSLAFWKRSSKKRSRASGGRFSFGLAEVNRVLVLMSVLLAGYVAFDAVASARNLQRPPDFAAPKDLKAGLQKESIAPLEESSYYLEKVSSRDIFREGKKEKAPVAETPAQAAEEGPAEEIEKLALVGISWSSNPDAIIEDKASQRTFFVKRGQMIGDSVKVEAIFKDHVVVTFEDREYELR